MFDDEFDEDMDELAELDEVQDALYAPAQWSWTFWASGQIDTIGKIVDSVGEMFHDTALQMRQHFRWKAERKHMVEDSLKEIEQLTRE